MGLQKYAAAEVLSAELAGSTQKVVRRTAHRHDFRYTPREGYLYVRSRAISSRTNDNYDMFPAEEIKKAYRTFVGRPVFVNHHNDDHRRARGVIIDAALHEDVNPDGSPDTWAEVLMEVDAKRFPLLAKAILAGEIDRTSMGTDVAYSQCTACGNVAKTPLDYCSHIPRMKGQHVYKTTASGEKIGILVAERCFGLNFFENSLLVEDPADPTAFFLGVEAGPGVETPRARAGAKTAEMDKRVGLFGIQRQAGEDDLDLAERFTSIVQHVAGTTGSHPGQLSPEEFEKMGPWVFHATSDKRDRDKLANEGVRMSNVPNNLARQRYERGEPSEYAPGGGIGKGLYVSKHAWQTTGYGRHLIGISGVQPHELATPPESTVPGGGVEDALNDHNGAMIVKDIPKERVHDLGPIDWEAQPDHWYAVYGARKKGLDVGANQSLYPDMEKRLARKTAADDDGPSVAGVAVKAADTGRVLMLQRSIGDEDDPAAGTWEFPGGHVEGDEGLFNGAVREWQEETGHSFPSGDPGGVWDSGDVYRGFLWIVPSEDAVPIHDLNAKEHINPDDPDGDDTESVAWWEPEQLPKNPAVRDEVRSGTDWDLLGVTRPKTARTSEEFARGVMDEYHRLGKDEHRGPVWRDFGRPNLLTPGAGDAATTDNGFDAYSDGYEDGFNDVAKPFSQKYTRPEHADAFWEGYQDGQARRQTAAGLVTEAKPRFEPGGHPWYQANPVNPDNIIEHFNRATPEDREQGRRWYSDANLVATAIAGGDAHKGAGVLAAYSPQAFWPTNMFNAARALQTKQAMGGKGSGVFATESMRKQAQAIIDGGKHPEVLKGPKIQDFAHLIEHGGQHPLDTMTHVVIDRHALAVAAGKRLTDAEAEKAPLDNRHYYGHVAEQYRQAAQRISDMTGEKWEPHQVQAATWLVRQRENAMDDADRGSRLDVGREKSRNKAQETWRSFAGEHYPTLAGPGYHAAGLQAEGALPEYPPLNGELCRIQTANGGDGEDHLWSRGTGYPVRQEVPYGWGFRWLDPSEIRSIEVIGPKKEGSRHEALGEQTAPSEVDTLRDENCPVCGEDDSFNGAECIVCGYVAPPKQFRDPDLSVAQNNDLREDKEDAAAGSGIAPTPGSKPTIIVQTKGGSNSPTVPNTNTPQNSRPVTSGRRPTIRIVTTRQKDVEYA